MPSTHSLTILPGLLTCALLFAAASHAQTPAERYAKAAAILAAHTLPYQHVHDSSSAAVAALEDLTLAQADAVVDYLAAHPQAKPAQIAAALCTSPTTAAVDCSEAFAPSEKDIVPLVSACSC